MKHQYPRIGVVCSKNQRPFFADKDICGLCELPGAGSVVDIQVSIFRGDDECYLVHRACLDRGVSFLGVKNVVYQLRGSDKA